MTKVVTFYSYKGGVGRTMALVNVAHVLARDGWRVLMVDFDLEAPGMTHFFAEQVRKRPKSVTKDALDLLLHARSTINWDPIEKKPKPGEYPKSLAEYVVPIPLPDKWKDNVIPYRTGRLDLLPATLDPVEPEEAPEAEPSRDYLRRMDELDLQGVFDVGGPRHWFGDHVRHYFVNARFRTKGDIVFTLRDKVWAAYDIVLVDSRTGLNEVAGLCIGPLCDALVICTGLNDQSIYGTKYFMKKSGLFDRGKAKPYTLVAGPVPLWHKREADERIALLRKELRCDTVVEIPYHPAAALLESKFVLDEPGEPITQAYERLAPVAARLAKAAAGEDPERWVVCLMMRARHAEGGWPKLQREVAQRVAKCWLRQQWGPFVPIGLLGSLPTAASLMALATKGREPRASDDGAAMPFTAAVSAYRSQSDQAFRRAWKILAYSPDQDRHDELRVRLLFMQLGVLGTLPDREVGYPVLHTAYTRAEKWVKRGWLTQEEASRLWDTLLTVESLWGRETPWGHDRNGELLRLAAAGLRKQAGPVTGRVFLRGSLCWDMMGQPPPGAWLEQVIQVAPDLWQNKLEPEPRGILDDLVCGTRLPEQYMEIAQKPEAIQRPMAHLMMHEAIFQASQEGGSWFDFPLGLWPEPVMAAAVALVKGPRAVKEVLGWLMLARFAYGYAWRVLVDWRHLASVKDHPLFVEFIRQEDELVDEIEGAIDRGEYTL